VELQQKPQTVRVGDSGFTPFITLPTSYGVLARRAPPVSAGWGLNIEFEHGFGGKLRWLICYGLGLIILPPQ